MKSFKFSVLIYFIVFTSKSFAQNYNINIVPTRIIYEKDDLFNKNKITPLFLYKYIEIERKYKQYLSLNLGIAIDKGKVNNFSGFSKDLFYKLEPSIRYYFNKYNNMSGFYLASGINYYRYSYLRTGRFTGDDNLVERNLYRNYVRYSFYGGYKFCIIKNRFSIDLKLNNEITIFNSQKAIKIFKNGEIENNNFKFSNGILEFPYVDLKLGYRFGFKK